MPFAVFVVYLVSVLYLSVLTSSKMKDRTQEIVIGDYDPATRGLTERGKYEISFDGASFPSAEKMQAIELETVEGVLLRACKNIHTLSLVNGCINPYREDNVWVFVGIPGGTGPLSATWTGSTTPVFACGAANIAEYGRGLVQAALPSEVIINRGFQYDFGDMFALNETDPCAYTGIVSE